MPGGRVAVLDWLLAVLSLDVGDAWRLLVHWLRWPRHRKRGELAPLFVTHDGVAVSSLDRVPLRSTKADAKREALVWARRHWNDPTLTWGQARKRIRKLEARIRNRKLDDNALLALEAVRDE